MHRSLVVVALALSLPTALACGETKPPGATSSAPPTQRGAAAAAAQAAAAAIPTTDAGIAKEEYTENDFVENDRNRDPFRSYLKIETRRRDDGPSNQLAVKLSQFGVEELKLVAIVLGGDGPRAMLIDPTGKGWVLQKGDYVGRAEIVHTGGQNGADYQLNWRVDRIREENVVLLREDRANPNVPPASRVIPLHTEADRQELPLN